MRSLIDMPADRGAFIDQSAVAQSVHGKPEHRQALVDVHVRMAKGFEDDLLPAFASGDPDRAGRRPRYERSRPSRR